MQVLHLGQDFHIKKLNPYMHPFGVVEIASIAFKVGLFQSDFACAYRV
jgi:hypothetical protein